MADCLFCNIASGKIPAEKVYEDDDAVAFRDISPQAPTHILIIPRKHIETLNDLGEGDATLIGKLILVARKLADSEGISESGYRTVFNCNQDAGQAVFHIHLHLLGGRAMKWPPG
jgi:histidine triad (HIT) family protein